MNEGLKRFLGKFKEICGIDFMFPLHESAQNYDGFDAVISPEAKGKIYQVEESLFNFKNNAPEGYLFAGFFNEGGGKWAFYYCKSNENEKIYFKFPYSGEKDEIETIKSKLILFKEFEEKALGKVLKINLQDSMENSYYNIIYKNGKENDANYAPEEQDYRDILKEIGAE